MKKETLYLDTSIPSAYYDNRVKDRQVATIKFWREVLPQYQTYISEITEEELSATKDDVLRRNFKRLVKGFEVLRINEKIKDLAKVYIEKEIFLEKYSNDALHVATGSFYGVTYLVSWNFEHLVKVRTRKSVKLVNILHGYGEIEIISP